MPNYKNLRIYNLILTYLYLLHPVYKNNITTDIKITLKFKNVTTTTLHGQ